MTKGQIIKIHSEITSDQTIHLKGYGDPFLPPAGEKLFLNRIILNNISNV